VWCGTAGVESHRLVREGEVRWGKAGMERIGSVALCAVGQGAVRQVWQGAVRCGTGWLGNAG
jgi:hypothetical protein